jgi:hypothetical protein
MTAGARVVTRAVTGVMMPGMITGGHQEGPGRRRNAAPSQDRQSGPPSGGFRNTAEPSGEIYDDQEPRCPLCASQEHKPRLLTADDHSAPSTAPPGAGEAWRGPQPKLSGAVPLPLPVAPGRRPSRVHTAPVRARPFPVPAIPVVPGYPARLWPPSPQLAGHVNVRRMLLRSPQSSPSLTRKRVQTEVPSGLAASSADHRRHRHPGVPCRCAAHPWQATSRSGASAPAMYPCECRLPAGITLRDGIGMGDSGPGPGARR